jgi:NhaA family Na+:H+ antiporter
MRRIVRDFLELEASSSIVLMLAAVLALVIANSRFYPFYEWVLHTPFDDFSRHAALQKPLVFWINDGLMVLFFFLIGLEIKREVIGGHLSIASQRVLPVTATLGGIILPALLFALFNYDIPSNLKGCAIPTATDIAFALGILMLIKNIPRSLKVFLLTIAVLDDLGAVLIIAIFYTSNISILFLLAALFVLIALLLLNKMNINKPSFYITLSIVLWICILQSGVHPTIAGILAAFTIPFDRQHPKTNLLITLERTLHPFVAYGVLPIFAFANSGLPLEHVTFAHLTDPLTLGIIVGLFFGKQLGVLIGSWIPIKLKWASLPKNVSWSQLYGTSILCGIGFTMSLFIGALAFKEGAIDYSYRTKIGILIASLGSIIFGYLILKFSKRIGQS